MSILHSGEPSPTSNNALDEYLAIITSSLEASDDDLRDINRLIHANPELGYREFLAHDTICDYLDRFGFTIQKHAYGLETSFECQAGESGPLVIFCAEYDALPEMGHGCGHNLIATSAIGAFVATADVVLKKKLPVRVRLLGTPAEEGFAAKVRLLNKGAFDDPEIVAALMAHPVPLHQVGKVGNIAYHGVAGLKLIATHKLLVEYRGKSAHASADPWNGVNALDAAVAGYQNVAMMRQHMEPNDRVHGCFQAAGTVPSIIPEYSRMSWYIRSPTKESLEKLIPRVRACLEAGAVATGCAVHFMNQPSTLNLRVNEPLCRIYADSMARIGQNVLLYPLRPSNASTDMGDVSHHVPSFHGTFGVPTEDDVGIHSRAFAEASGSDEAYESCVKAACGMALLATRLLTDESLAKDARCAFESSDYD